MLRELFCYYREFDCGILTYNQRIASQGLFVIRARGVEYRNVSYQAGAVRLGGPEYVRRLRVFVGAGY